jgi:hypothetical protein
MLNSTLLLLGTFPFELWFESYLSFTLESLYFWKITGRPLSSTSSPSPCSTSARAREPRCLHRPCATHLLPCATLLCATCLPSARAAVPHPALALSSPLHVVPPPPEPPRTPPVANSCSRMTVPSSGPRARPGAPRELALALAYTHFAHLSLPRALHLAVWQNQPELYWLKYASPLPRAPTCFKRYNTLACQVTSR